MSITQKIGIAIGATALAVGAGFGATQLTSTVQAANASSAQQQGPGGRGGPGQRGMEGPGQSGRGAPGQNGTDANSQGGTGAANQQGDAMSQQGDAMSQQGGGPAGPNGMAGGAPTELVTKIATEFNLDQTKVQTALTTAFSDLQSQNAQPGDAMDAALAKQLASQLGVDETKLKQTLVTFRSSMQEPGQGSPDSGPANAPAGQSGVGPTVAASATTN